MGRASSSKKVQRAAKAAGRPGAKKNYGWPMTIGAVVLLGVFLIVLTVTTNDDPGDTGPPSFLNNDHWHAAYSIYNCDEPVDPLQNERASDPGGIHTHGEGLMHIEPLVSRTSGKGANLFNFGQQVGLKVTDTSFKTPDLQRKNGDRCGGKLGRVELVTWDSPQDTTPTVRTKDLADYAPPDGSVWVLAFVPKGTEVPMPASIANLQDPTGTEEGQTPPSSGVDNSSTTSSTPGPSSSTSAPPDSSSTTSSSTP